MPSKRVSDTFLVLTSNCALKILEKPCVYRIDTDNLYELDNSAFRFLKSCITGVSKKDIVGNKDFIDFCLRDGILEFSGEKKNRIFSTQPSPTPSLRYLELLMTGKCNLKCRHCYLGESGGEELSLESLISIFNQFEEMGGLRILLSGGEPLLSSSFWKINKHFKKYEIRFVLLTNATLITKEKAEELNVHEAQISLDGWEISHDKLRGKNSFRKAIDGIYLLKEAGIEISVATIIHRYNIKDFQRLEKFVHEIDAESWNIDFLCDEGNLKVNKDFFLPYEDASPFLNFAFGKNFHSSSDDYACGAHLACITPKGNICKCGYFENEPVGNVEEGLRLCWEKLPHIKLNELECDCNYLEECRGGCRYRALLSGNILSKDPAKCAFYRIKIQ